MNQTDKKGQTWPWIKAAVAFSLIPRTSASSGWLPRSARIDWFLTNAPIAETRGQHKETRKQSLCGRPRLFISVRHRCGRRQKRKYLVLTDPAAGSMCFESLKSGQILVELGRLIESRPWCATRCIDLVHQAPSANHQLAPWHSQQSVVKLLDSSRSTVGGCDRPPWRLAQLALN